MPYEPSDRDFVARRESAEQAILLLGDRGGYTDCVLAVPHLAPQSAGCSALQQIASFCRGGQGVVAKRDVGQRIKYRQHGLGSEEHKENSTSRAKPRGFRSRPNFHPRLGVS